MKQVQTRVFSFRTPVFLFLCAAIFFLSPPQTNAGYADNIVGWAWSGTAGWISFNCLNNNACGSVEYGVAVSPQGVFSGYAWNDAVGWISFNAEDLRGCPSGLCEARLTGNNVRGWARALGGIENEGGFDGWISLSDSSYGVSLRGSGFSGYAWGAGGIGWISFYNGPGKSVLVQPIVSAHLSVTPTTIVQGQNATVTWKSDNAAGCTGEYFDTNGAPSGSARVSPLITTMYRVRCSGIGGSSSAYAPLAVTAVSPRFEANPASVVEGNSSVLTWTCPFSTGSSGVGFSTGGKVSGSVSVIPADTTGYVLQCSPHGNHSAVVVSVLHPSVSLEVSPSLVRPNQTTTLSWVSSLVIPGSCRLAGPGISVAKDSGSAVTPPIAAQSVYTLTCKTKRGQISDDVVVNLTPNFQ